MPSALRPLFASQNASDNGGESMPFNKNASAPSHLSEINWLDFEQERAQSLCQSLDKELANLSRSATAKRVHDARVMLRRWISVWEVLKDDGWQSKKFKRHAGKKLKRLLNLLGVLRDWDVNLELGKKLGVRKSILASWQKERQAVRKKVKEELAGLDVKKTMERLQTHLDEHSLVLKKGLSDRRHQIPVKSAYEHLIHYLALQEERVQALEMQASTAKELHKLRLSIKRWRYLLTEFFGLTNLELVRAQQILGRLHDYDRLKGLLADQSSKGATQKLEKEQSQLLKQFADIRRRLPYGLRPYAASETS